MHYFLIAYLMGLLFLVLASLVMMLRDLIADSRLLGSGNSLDNMLELGRFRRRLAESLLDQSKYLFLQRSDFKGFALPLHHFNKLGHVHVRDRVNIASKNALYHSQQKKVLPLLVPLVRYLYNNGFHCYF